LLFNLEAGMNVFGVLAVIFLLAFLVESLVEYLFGQVFVHVPAIQPYSWLLMYVSAAVGVLAAFLYGFDLLYLLSQYTESPLQTTWFGMLLTGLAIGRGSNYLHDIVSKFFVKPKSPGLIG
jgi:hypothetical protein